jgi:hypothetical protein
MCPPLQGAALDAERGRRPEVGPVPESGARRALDSVNAEVNGSAPGELLRCGENDCRWNPFMS